jgi:hypothetical protein
MMSICTPGKACLMRVSIDSGGFLAVMDRDDPLHPAARDISARLESIRAQLYTSNYIVLGDVVASVNFRSEGPGPSRLRASWQASSNLVEGSKSRRVEGSEGRSAKRKGHSTKTSRQLAAGRWQPSLMRNAEWGTRNDHGETRAERREPGSRGAEGQRSGGAGETRRQGDTENSRQRAAGRGTRDSQIGLAFPDRED